MRDKSGFILTLFILVHCAVCNVQRAVHVGLLWVYFHNAQAGTRIEQMDIPQMLVAANLLS